MAGPGKRSFRKVTPAERIATQVVLRRHDITNVARADSHVVLGEIWGQRRRQHRSRALTHRFEGASEVCARCGHPPSVVWHA